MTMVSKALRNFSGKLDYTDSDGALINVKRFTLSEEFVLFSIVSVSTEYGYWLANGRAQKIAPGKFVAYGIGAKSQGVIADLEWDVEFSVELCDGIATVTGVIREGRKASCFSGDLELA